MPVIKIYPDLGPIGAHQTSIFCNQVFFDNDPSSATSLLEEDDKRKEKKI